MIYTEGTQKAARFIMDCNQNLVPLVFLHDVNGFMVGKDAEWSGIIRAGAKMVSAVSTSVVPKISVIIGGSFGAGHYAMCGKAYDPRFLFAWPTARYAVMSGASAANTLAEVRAKQLERSGKVLSDAERTALHDEIRAAYDEQADPRYGAARLWIDAIIDPEKTREVLIAALDACALNPDVPRFNPGRCCKHDAQGSFERAIRERRSHLSLRRSLMAAISEPTENLYPFVLTEEQEQLRKEIRAFATREIAPHIMAWDEKSEFPVEAIKKVGQMGLLGAIFPPWNTAATSLGYVDYVLAIEELSAVDGSIGITVAAHNSLGTNHIFLCGNEAQKRKYVPKLAEAASGSRPGR